jgi:hypothetical protein
LTRVGKGNASTFTCPFQLLLQKRQSPGQGSDEYFEGFAEATRGLKKARIERYRGFGHARLDVTPLRRGGADQGVGGWVVRQRAGVTAGTLAHASEHPAARLVDLPD